MMFECSYISLIYFILPPSITKFLITILTDLQLRVLPFLRDDDVVVKLSEWGEGYLFSLPAAIAYIRNMYRIGINRHSDTFIIHNTRNIRIENIEYGLLVAPSKGHIMNTPHVNNAKDFPYEPSRDDPSPLLSRLGVVIDRGVIKDSIHGCNNALKKKKIESNDVPCLFPGPKELNLTYIAQLLN